MQTRSGTARCGEVGLFYEDLGDPADPPVLLIMGVGAQLPMWPDGFCAQLVKQGYRVIRFGHRDTGLSSKLQNERRMKWNSRSLTRWQQPGIPFRRSLAAL
jgi:pimeloyl-ACP methyl ester carboxylesterase